MTERQTEPEAGPVVKVARDLTEIEKLTVALEAEVPRLAQDRLMPGGRALVALARHADLDEWSERIAAAELRHYASCDKVSHRDCTVHNAEHVEDEDDQHAEDPLRTLLWWADAWRTRYGYPLEGRTPTLRSEAHFLRGMLDAAWDSDAEWSRFATDVNQVRRRLEDLVHAGQRAERSRVLCPHCEKHPQLVRVYALRKHELPEKDEDVRWWQLLDHFKCPNSECRHRFDDSEFRRVYTQQLRSEGAERFVPAMDALATLRDQGRPERTIRKWLGPNQEDPEDVVHGYCDVRTRRVFLWWPDLWRRHLVTAVRRRAA